MSLLFAKKHRRRMQIVWSVLSVLIVVLMIALYMPVLFAN